MTTKTSTYSFGSGSVICLAGGVATTIGTLQEIQIDISSTNVTLMGQNQFAVAVARGEGKVTGTAKSGQIDLQLFSSLYLGQAIDATGYTKQVAAEAHTIPASSAYTVTVTNSASISTTFIDLGVFYASGAGELKAVAAGSEAVGKYSVNASTGVYTFAAADEGLGVLISYSYFAATGSRVLMTNQLMGFNPVFQLFLSNGYANVQGITYTTLKLYSCVSNKMSLPFKNKDFVVNDFAFDCFADQSGNILELGIGT